MKRHKAEDMSYPLWTLTPQGQYMKKTKMPWESLAANVKHHTQPFYICQNEEICMGPFL